MKFAEVLEIKNGKNQKQVEDADGKYPIYGSGGIMGRATDYICPAETVIIGRKGTINNPIYVDTPFWNVDTAFGLVADKNILLPKYLYYFCKHFDFLALNTTVTIPSLTKANLLKIDIPVPNMDDQQYVVRVLDDVENLIEIKTNEKFELDNLVKSRFIEMFGTVHNNTNDFEIKCLQDVCEQIKDGTHQTPEYTTDTVNGYKFLSSKDVTTGYISWENIKYIPEYLHKDLYARIAPQRGDLLLAKNGTTGIAAVVDCDEVFDIYVSLALLRPVDINSVYLWAAVNSTTDCVSSAIAAFKSAAASFALGYTKKLPAPVKVYVPVGLEYASSSLPLVITI